jgi:serine/threonine protein phosphatase PrpC
MTNQPSPFAPLTVRVSGMSDPGRHRPDNQDTIGWTEMRVGGVGGVWQLAVIADGVGGHAGGAAASRCAVQRVLSQAAEIRERPDTQWLGSVVESANTAVHKLATEMHEAGNMGTTVVVLLCSDREAMVAHVGDSRLYLVRHHVCRQVTADHSFVWWLMAQGEIGQDEVDTHPRHGVITRCLGVRPTVEVELVTPLIPLRAGDRFLLCSDGLTDVLTDQDIAVVLGDHPPDEAARALVDLANRRDTRDNVSAIVVAVDAVGVHG